jgi:hypothetical protein
VDICWFWQEGCKIDFASWTQAIGSVLAILVAIGVAGWQSYSSKKQAIELEIREKDRLLLVLYNLAMRIHYFFASIDEQRSKEGGAETYQTREYYRRKLLHYQAEMDKIPIYYLPSFETYQQVVKLKEELDRAERELFKLKDDPIDTALMTCSELYGKNWRPMVGNSREAMELLRDELNKFAR